MDENLKEHQEHLDWLKGLEEISKQVDKMPEWKKNGWAILEDEKYYCGVEDNKND